MYCDAKVDINTLDFFFFFDFVSKFIKVNNYSEN